MDYYDFSLHKTLDPSIPVRAEDRDGRKVKHAAELLVTETGDMLMRVYIPPKEVRSAGDLSASDLGRTVNVSGVSGIMAAVRHAFQEGEPYTEIIWKGSGPSSFIPSRSSAYVED